MEPLETGDAAPTVSPKPHLLLRLRERGFAIELNGEPADHVKRVSIHLIEGSGPLVETESLVLGLSGAPVWYEMSFSSENTDIEIVGEKSVTDELLADTRLAILDALNELHER